MRFSTPANFTFYADHLTRFTGSANYVDSGWTIPTDNGWSLLRFTEANNYESIGSNTSRQFLIKNDVIRNLPGASAGNAPSDTNAYSFDIDGATFKIGKTSTNNLLIQNENSQILEILNVSFVGGTSNGGMTSGREPRDPVNGEYLHLGTGTFNESLTEGSAEKTGLVDGQRGIFTTTADIALNTILRFDNTLMGASIPGGSGNYNSGNGQIILPAGHWLVCASLKARLLSGTFPRLYTDLAIMYGGNVRHAQSGYTRNIEGAGIQGTSNFAARSWVSVTGAVVSDGSTPITIGFGAEIQDGGTFRLEGAHIHAYKQVV